LTGCRVAAAQRIVVETTIRIAKRSTLVVQRSTFIAKTSFFIARTERRRRRADAIASNSVSIIQSAGVAVLGTRAIRHGFDWRARVP
jgi:hypothetical protein